MMYLVFIIIGFVVVFFARSIQRSTPIWSPESKMRHGSEDSFVSIEEIRIEFNRLLSESAGVIVNTSQDLHPTIRQLGVHSVEFFERYSSFEIPSRGFEISVRSIEESEFVQGFISIGHSEDWDIVSRPGGDEVFVVEGSELCESDFDICFPSIYHLAVEEMKSIGR